MKLEFIDVSHHQRQIDWNKAASVIDGAIIRCGLRGYGIAGKLQADSYWERNIKGAVNAGVPRIGSYFFGQAVNAAEGKEEAEYALKLLTPHRASINFPVYYDTEKTSVYPNGRADRISKTARTEAVKAFCERIREAGFVPGVYASLSYFDEGLNKAELDGYTWWVAAYRDQRPDAAKDAWQYIGSGGRCAGVQGDCDRSYWYRDFSLDFSRDFSRDFSQDFSAPVTGWQKADGKWYWYENGKPVKSAWRQVKGFWYYLGADGVMLTGTQKINGKVYHLHEQAAFGLPEGALVVTDEEGEVRILP